ncbi:GTP binding protein [Dinochytrium kinnereticum]|nr:GTP binding protein [Dinochytrium kinnereticum]
MEFGSRLRYKRSFMRERINGNVLPQEVDDEGNVEYKLKLVNPPPERLEHLITQMKWRLAEGHGEAMYEVGVADDGEVVGLSPEDMEASLSTLEYMAEQLNADASVIRRRKGTSVTRIAAEVLVRKRVTDSQHFLEVRVAILGGVDAGKSTLLGVLTHSELDNGRGKSRLNLLRHRHEIVSGRTSSISHQIIGFDASGDLVNYRTTSSLTSIPSPPSSNDGDPTPRPPSSGTMLISSWEQVCEVASKLVTFLDTCGHPKYQRTTLSGITGSHPDYACLIIGGTAGGVSEVPREHLGVAVGLGVPVFVVITKIDVADREQLTGTVGGLLRVMRSEAVRREPKIIKDEDDLVEAVAGLDSARFIPIFLVSSVTGENVPLLIKFLNLLPKRPTSHADGKKAGRAVGHRTDDVEFGVEEIYSVPSVGYVLGGILKSGIITTTQATAPPSPPPDSTSQAPTSPTRCQPLYLLGPDRGRFIPIRISSIQRQRCAVGSLSSGQAGTLAISFPPDLSSSRSSLDPPGGFRIRKGQVVVPYVMSPTTREWGDPEVGVNWEFEADLHILHAPPCFTALGTQGVIYCGGIVQGAKIISVESAASTPPRRCPSINLEGLLEDGPVVAPVMVVSGMRVRVRFAFASEPEWVRVGRFVLFRGGRLKCVGKVVRVFGGGEGRVLVGGGLGEEGEGRRKKRRGRFVEGEVGGGVGRDEGLV